MSSQLNDVYGYFKVKALIIGVSQFASRWIDWRKKHHWPEWSLKLTNQFVQQYILTGPGPPLTLKPFFGSCCDLADFDLALVKTFVGRPFPWNSLQLYSQSNCCLVNSKLSFSSPIDLTHTIVHILRQHRIVISLIRNTSFYFYFKFTVNPAVCHFPLTENDIS